MIGSSGTGKTTLMRAVETYAALAARAASCGFIDVEVKALIDMVYPLSWTDAERSLRKQLGPLDRMLHQLGQSFARVRR